MTSLADPIHLHLVKTHTGLRGHRCHSESQGPMGLLDMPSLPPLQFIGGATLLQRDTIERSETKNDEHSRD